MPGKNNLTFEAQEPSFLQKIRAQAGRRDPHRQEHPAARPQRAKAIDEDDGPTLVDEENLDLSKEDYEALKAGKEVAEAKRKRSEEDLDTKKDGGPSEDQDHTESNGSRRNKQEVTEIGKTQKKRKAVKVAAADADEIEEKAVVKTTKRPKKKAKASTLSFGGVED